MNKIQRMAESPFFMEYVSSVTSPHEKGPRSKMRAFRQGSFGRCARATRRKPGAGSLAPGALGFAI